MIHHAQDNTTTNYLTLTTIAFFLSGTTASVLQVSADDSANVTGIAANSLFFSSLVFSIGSAVNSLLVMGWHKSIACVLITSFDFIILLICVPVAYLIRLFRFG